MSIKTNESESESRRIKSIGLLLAKSSRDSVVLFGIALLISGLVIAPALLTNPARADSVIATIPVGAHPNSIAFDSANGNLYVTNYLSSTVSVINGATNTVVGSP